MDEDGKKPLSPVSDLISSFHNMLQLANRNVETLQKFDSMLSEELETASNASASASETDEPENPKPEPTGDTLFHTPPSEAKQKPEIQRAMFTDNEPQITEHTAPLVEHRDNYISQDTAAQAVGGLENLFSDRRGKYVWLSKHNSTYSFGRTTLHAEQIFRCEPVNGLLEKVNSDLGLELDSCLVSRYVKKEDQLSFHQDNEPEIDQKSPIVNISIGPSREIQFADNTRSGDIKMSFTLHSGSLLRMNPGCQSKLWHRVMPGEDSSTTRFSLSFRRVALKVPPHKQIQNLLLHHTISTPIKPSLSSTLKIQNTPNTHISSQSLTMSGNLEFSPEDPTSKRDELPSMDKRHLVIGDSMTKGLVIPGSIIMSKGGGHSNDIIPLLHENEDLLAPEEYKTITTVTLCVGTNSLNVTRDMKIPMVDIISDYNKLVIDLQTLFPLAKIGLFNVIPRECQYRETYDRIHDFNIFGHDHIASSFKNTHWIYLYWEFCNGYGSLNLELYGKKLLHLSPLGKQMMSDTILEFQKSF